MPVSLGSLLIAFASAIGLIGLAYEIGKRQGETEEEQRSTDELLDDLSEHVDARFDDLSERVDSHVVNRRREHKVVLDWLVEITEALKSEGYDVAMPEEVTREFDMSLGDTDD